jgi:hypothetical protein
MQTRLICLSMIIFLGLGYACTEIIEIELDDTLTRLVIDGGVTSEKGHHLVRLSRSVSYFYNQEPPPVEGASLSITDGTQSFRMIEMDKTPGVYVTREKIAAVPGKTYLISVELREPVNNASSYKATAHMPSTLFRLDSIQMEYNPTFDFWLVKVYAFDPPSRDFYRFDTFLNGINGNDTTSRTIATPDRFFNGKNTNGFAIAFFEGDILNAGDTITTIMSALHEDYYNFYSELTEEAGSKNPLFSGPPANIRSNLREGGLGYFSARIVKKTSLLVPDLRKK